MPARRAPPARREPPAGLACLALCLSGRGDGLLLPGPGGCRAGTPSRGLHADGHRGDSSALPRGGPPGRAAAGSKLTSTGEGPTRAAGWRPRSRFATPADAPRASKSVTHTADPATSSQRLPERTPCRALWGYDDRNRFCRTRGVGGARAASSDRIRETSSAERRLVPLRGQGAGAQGGGAPWAGQTGALAPKAIIRSLTHLFSRSVSHRVVEIFRN